MCSFRATQIKTYSWDNAQVIMVGNKCDMDEERVVPPEKGKHLADQLGERTLRSAAKSSASELIRSRHAKLVSSHREPFCHSIQFKWQ